MTVSCAVSADSLMAAMDGVAYLVDPDGILVSIAGQQCAANPAFRPADFLGRKLAAMVQGAKLRDYYARVLDAIASGRQGNVAFECRCDTPDERRIMRIAMTPVDLGAGRSGALVQSTILSADPRPRVPLLERIAERSAGDAEDADDAIVTMCSFCQRLRMAATGPHSEWMEPEDYYREGGRSDVLISHGLCLNCVGRLE